MALVVALGVACAHLFRQLVIERDRSQAYQSRLHGPDVRAEANVGVSPAVQFIAYEAKRRAVLARYGDFVRQLKLSDDQTEALIQLMVELRESERRLRDPESLQKVQMGIESRIKSQLGDNVFAAYKEYQKTLAERYEINLINTRVALMDAPLDGRQKDKLIAIMLDEKALTPPPGGRDDPSYFNWQVAYEKRLRQRFSEILNPTQLREFDIIQAARLAKLRATLAQP